MNRGRRKRQVCNMLIGILFCCVGCGLQQEKQNRDASEMATDAAFCIAEDYHSEKVQNQLEILAENAHKWRVAGDENRTGNDEIRYVVTDLDRNGRLEIMTLKDQWMEDRDLLQGFFEVNASGDGVVEIASDQMGDVSLGDMLGNLDSAYYDPKTGECHYVMGNEMPEEEMLSDESEDYEKNIFALTLKQGQFSCDTLAYQSQIKTKTGKMQSRFYQVDETGKTEIDPSEYTVEGLGDAVYPDCGKYSVCFSTFFFDHSLEDMTVKQMHHALEKSYRESFMGYPLEQKEKKVAGQKIRVPQYSTMQDAGKQKRINQMIVKHVEQSLQPFNDSQDAENDWSADITIKYAGGDRASLFLWANKLRQGEDVQGDTESRGEDMQWWDTICDTINIDLEQGTILSEQDLLSGSDREYVVEEIQEEIEDEREEYKESGKKQNYDNIYENLLEHLEKWQEISLYQTGDMIGIVIPTGLTSDPYDIRELWNDASDNEDDSMSFAEIDWEAYQYRMLDSEYQSLQDYMPVLTGGAEFVYLWDEWEDDEEETAESQNMTISSWIGKNYDEEMAEDISVSEVCICDLTQDGKTELILEFSGGTHLILHKEGNTYYGTMRGRRSLCGLQTNGVYGAGKADYYFYQMHFEKDHFVEEYLGGSEYPIQAEDVKEEDIKYYIGDQKVEKDVYEKWKKSIMTEFVSWYNPEALVKGNSGK